VNRQSLVFYFNFSDGVREVCDKTPVFCDFVYEYDANEGRPHGRLTCSVAEMDHWMNKAYQNMENTSGIISEV
jgi:hypothetical protein